MSMIISRIFTKIDEKNLNPISTIFTFLIMLKVLRGVKAFRQNSLQKNTT